MKSDDEPQREHPWGRTRIGLPVAHLLALAPLDVWVGMLARADVKPRYWGRMAFILFTSFVGTAISIHERLAMWLYWRSGRGRRALEGFEPRVIVIVGYYRSGTTHLHNLLSCDRRAVTPRWYQCLVGQGYVLAWLLVRVLLVPFLGRTRPQDSVGFGPEWPGEDDFALASWGGCSSLPGRHVFPRQWDRWKRWHDLQGLNEEERDTWRRLTKRFVYKVTRGRTDRVVVLKSPSHTARIEELDRLFKGRVRFVHLVREPGAVIDSNVRMMHALRNHALEDLPGVQTIRERIVEEYAATEAKCRDELDALDSDRWVRVRFRDLRSDPMGTLQAVYDGLGMSFDEPMRQSIRAYLGSLGSYVSTHEPIELGTVDERERLAREEMTRRYGLDTPGRSGRAIEYTALADAMVVRGMIAGLSVAMACWGAWVVLVGAQHAIGGHMRMLALIWVAGALIGLGARKASGRGTRWLGVWCGLLTLILVPTVLFPVSVINWNWAVNDGFDAWWYHNWRNVAQALAGTSSKVLVVLGVLSAYRHGSEDGPIVPGR